LVVRGAVRLRRQVDEMPGRSSRLARRTSLSATPWSRSTFSVREQICIVSHCCNEDHVTPDLIGVPLLLRRVEAGPRLKHVLSAAEGAGVTI